MDEITVYTAPACLQYSAQTPSIESGENRPNRRRR
jgi:hypothetical protein